MTDLVEAVARAIADCVDHVETRYSFDEIAERAIAAYEAARWQDISSAPRDGTWVMVSRPSYKIPCVARWRIDTWESPTLFGMIYDGVTHWIPLPPAPEATRGEK